MHFDLNCCLILYFSCFRLKWTFEQIKTKLDSFDSEISGSHKIGEFRSRIKHDEACFQGREPKIEESNEEASRVAVL